MLDGSFAVTSCRDTNHLEDALPETHMALEAAFVSEDEVSLLRRALSWAQTVSFELDQMADVEGLSSYKKTFESLEDPQRLLDRWGDSEQTKEAIHTKLVASAKELERTESRLWSMACHYPEHRNKLKQDMERKTGGSDGDFVIGRETMDMFKVVDRLSQAGQKGARHNVMLVRQGDEEYVIKEYVLSDSTRGSRCFLREASILRRLENPYIMKLSSAFIEERREFERSVMKGYLKMPLLVGGTFSSWVEHVKPSDQHKHRVLMQLSHKCDMYSYGLVMLEVLTEVWTSGSRRENITVMVARLQGEAKDLVFRLIDSNPSMRPSSVEALTHRYFSHAMILEREHLDKERADMRERLDRERQALAAQQDELKEREREMHQRRERVQREERQLLEQQRDLMSRGKQLEDDDRSRKEQLQKEKAELNKQESIKR
ncbi:hypothetical protein GUITHDRAFT_148185 [Guillardia theta CCMP2712]|uniref:Protein kinase domain-containing protein n=1 Tax=Guillardia theta (strain CCMP2712) TaxID=905079 RepID=L1IAC2_GUITC|nr:hypothetical protein GUITHDRAFT_148185 [Guillardia theta CCMP2712]EKX33062.1 hypothetical protein GUITHDRAFT_148185 [Guillardia theta CCMP2712]|eukprot:XP_005820042.1 hypothetical protein GUITHDRAFT_148185 [Guillardia theta CCMP2712]